MHIPIHATNWIGGTAMSAPAVQQFRENWSDTIGTRRVAIFDSTAALQLWNNTERTHGHT